MPEISPVVCMTACPWTDVQQAGRLSMDGCAAGRLVVIRQTRAMAGWDCNWSSIQMQIAEQSRDRLDEQVQGQASQVGNVQADKQSSRQKRSPKQAGVRVSSRQR